jgi:hypothetical protein
MSKKSIPNYLYVFQSRLDLLKSKIKKELEKPKKERTKGHLKIFLREARHLRNIVRDVSNEHAKLCPHCGKKI